MTRSVSFLAAAAALAFTPAVAASNDGVDAHVENAAAAIDGPSPVKLVAWNGDFELLKTSRRLRVWRSHLAYRMSVDAEGNATACELTEEFRSNYVNKTLCAVLMDHHEFAPALDESGDAVAGDYTARLSYLDIRERVE